MAGRDGITWTEWESACTRQPGAGAHKTDMANFWKFQKAGMTNAARGKNAHDIFIRSVGRGAVLAAAVLAGLSTSSSR